MLYETAARANEILALNIEDLDLARKRAAVIGKGGHREVVVWASGTARLLPRYLAGRRRGPVFVTNRRPNVVPAGPDQCPDTGLGRLSYNRAWSAFKTASEGWTLHQLRHPALTHLGEAGVSAILLQAKSRHQDPRTLARYTKPGVEAVAAHRPTRPRQAISQLARPSAPRRICVTNPVYPRPTTKCCIDRLRQPSIFLR